MEEYFEEKLKTKFGIDRMQLMFKFINVIDANDTEMADNFEKLKQFIRDGIGRDFQGDEYLNFIGGIANYIHSDEGTNERVAAMDYLFEMKFINN